MKTKSNPKFEGPFHAVLSCTALESPAIFFQAEDMQPSIANDPTALYSSFSTLEEAATWIETTEISPKRSRKRKASLLLYRTPSMRQQQNNETWEARFQELQRFTETEGDGDPNLALKKEYFQPKLADFIRTVRQDYAQHTNGTLSSKSIVDRKTRFRRMLELGVKLSFDKTYAWPQQAQTWRDFQLEHPGVNLVEDSPDALNAELARWQKHQIKEYTKRKRHETPHEMYPHRLEQLVAWDFPFPTDIQPPKRVKKSFEERLEEFIAWKEAKGSALLPQSIPVLGEWVKEQRKEYRKKLKGQKTYMSDERIAKLTAAGFIFEVRKNTEGATKTGTGPTVDLPALPPKAKDVIAEFIHARSSLII